MRITQEIQNTFIETLAIAIHEEAEIGGFALYIPEEDRLLTAVHPYDLPEGSIIKREKSRFDFNQELLEEVLAYNQGSSNKLYLGSNLFVGSGKIIGYHAHPLIGAGIAPSTDDRDHMNRKNSPVEIVISTSLYQQKKKTPFVAGYFPDDFQGKHVFDSSKVSHTDHEQLAKEHGITEEQVNELVYCHHITGLIPSIDFQIE